MRQVTFRVLHITPKLGGGGVEVFVHSLVEHLSLLGVRCFVVPFRERWKHYSNLFEFSLVDVIGFPLDFSLNIVSYRVSQFFRSIVISMKLIFLVKKYRINLIHLHEDDIKLAILLLRFCGKSGVLLVWTLHMVKDYSSEDAEKIVMMSKKENSNFLITQVSDYCLSTQFIERLVPKVITVPNGVDITLLEKYRRTRDNRSTSGIVRLGAVGRLEKIKGYDILIRAFSLLDFTRFELKIVGDGGEYNNLQTLIDHLGLIKRIQLLGRIDYPYQQISDFDIFIQPSRSEAFGLAIIEAMALGVPVIATRTGGVVDLLAQGNAGYLVNAEFPEGIADAVNELTSNEEMYSNFSIQGVMKASFFSVENMSRKYLELYFSLINCSGTEN